MLQPQWRFNPEVVAVERTALQVAREVHEDDASLVYARALDRLIAEYGVTADAHFVDAALERPEGNRDRLRTFVLEAGTGIPVPAVFLNGTPATSAVWVPLLGSLRGVRALVVDRPGHGLSEAFDYGLVGDVRTHAVGFLESILDALGLQSAVLVGNSLGGLWSLWLAAERPERVRALALPGLPPGLLTDRVAPIFGLLSVPWIAAALRKLDSPRSASTRRQFAMMGDPPGLLSDSFVETFCRATPRQYSGRHGAADPARAVPGPPPRQVVL